jgi:hypothetical protein
MSEGTDKLGEILAFINGVFSVITIALKGR